MDSPVVKIPAAVRRFLGGHNQTMFIIENNATTRHLRKIRNRFNRIGSAHRMFNGLHRAHRLFLRIARFFHRSLDHSPSLRVPWIEMRDAAQALPEFPLFFGDLFRHYYADDNEEISFFTRLPVKQSVSSHAQLLAIVRAVWNSHRYSILESRDHDLCTKNCLPWRQIEAVIEVSSANPEIGMRSETNPKIQIAWLTPTDPFVPHARNANNLAIHHSRRNFYLDRLGPCLTCATIGSLESEHSNGSFRRFLERNQNVAFEIATAAGKSRPPIFAILVFALGSITRKAVDAPTPAKELLKEIGKSSAI